MRRALVKTIVFSPALTRRTKSWRAVVYGLASGRKSSRCRPSRGAPDSAIQWNGRPVSVSANSPALAAVADEAISTGSLPTDRQSRRKRWRTWWKWLPKIPR